MRLYNPLRGKYVNELNWETGTFKKIPNETAVKLLDAYEWLVNYDLPKYQPDYYDSIKKIRFKSIRKLGLNLKLWVTGKTKVQ